MATRNEIIESFLNKYLVAPRCRQTQIIDIVESVTQMHRKAIIRSFRRKQLRDPDKPDRRGRKAYYTEDVASALETVWATLGELCGELIHPVIRETVEKLISVGEWWHDSIATEKLLVMSQATVKRLVGGFLKVRKKKRGLGATSPSHIKNIIPIFTGPWEGKPPGFGQIDTVVHCGESLRGDMVFSVNYTDVCTRWVVLAAQWNKSQEATIDSVKRMRVKTPFRILGLHPDSGNEFVNLLLKDWCDEEGIELTRSRPYHKNDNAYVEQKNGHVIRRFLGYDRLDRKELLPIINSFYDLLELHLNHFVPTRKCIEKIRIGSKYHRRYDTATTPYRRVLASPHVPQEVKKALEEEHSRLNPLKIRNQLDKLVAKIMRIQRHGST